MNAQTRADRRRALWNRLVSDGAASGPLPEASETEGSRAIAHFAAFLGAVASFSALGALFAPLMAHSSGRLVLGLLIALASFFADRSWRSSPFASNCVLIGAVVSRALVYSWLFETFRLADHPHAAAATVASIEFGFLAVSGSPALKLLSALAVLGAAGFELAYWNAPRLFAPACCVLLVAMPAIRASISPARQGAASAIERAALAGLSLGAVWEASLLALDVASGGGGSGRFSGGFLHAPFGRVDSGLGAVSPEAQRILSAAAGAACAFFIVRREGVRFGSAPEASGAASAAAIFALLVGWVSQGAALGLCAAAVGFAQGRLKTLSVGIFVALMSVCAFYYASALSLLAKSGLLALSAASIAAVGYALRRNSFASAPGARPPAKRALRLPPLGLAAAGAGALFLVFAGAAIWQKEALMSRGSTAILKLAPADPRSLMQGDYMALNFEVANQIRQALPPSEADSDGRGRVALLLADERGIARFDRLSDASGAEPSALKIKFRASGWRVALGDETSGGRGNAFFFQEGKGKAVEKARYGKFKLDPWGNAVLVELLDENLVAIAAAP